MSEAIQIKGDDLQLGHFQLTPTGLVVRGTPKFEEWENVRGGSPEAEGAVQFWIGDWLNYGEHTYGEKYAQAVSAAVRADHRVRSLGT